MTSEYISYYSETKSLKMNIEIFLILWYNENKDKKIRCPAYSNVCRRCAGRRTSFALHNNHTILSYFSSTAEFVSIYRFYPLIYDETLGYLNISRCLASSFILWSRNILFFVVLEGVPLSGALFLS